MKTLTATTCTPLSRPRYTCSQGKQSASMSTGHQAKEPCNCLYIRQDMFAAARQLSALHVSLCHLGLQNTKCQPSVVSLDLMWMLRSYTLWRQDLLCRYLAHHEPESANTVTISNTVGSRTDPAESSSPQLPFPAIRPQANHNIRHINLPI